MMRQTKIKCLNRILWWPLTIVILLTQCDGDDPDPGEGSRASENSGGAAESNRTASSSSLPRAEPLPGSASTRAGTAPGPQGQQSSSEASGETALPAGEPSQWEQQVNALNQDMKAAIASGDAQSLIRDFNAAVQLHGESLSSSTAVFGDLIPELGGNLEMARSLIDSMDPGKMMPAASAQGIALTIEDEDARKQWVQSLADDQVREDVLQLLGGQ